MKGALLMLALLVTRELTFETHEVEACPVFYEMQIIVNFVLPRAALNETFDSVSATDEEKAAFGKIQDCFIEVGHQNRVNHLIFKILVIFSKDCTGYRVSTLWMTSEDPDVSSGTLSTTAVLGPARGTRTSMMS
ncbi:major allergen I polypeptide chain 2-like [Ovis canadensis]|uniref:major allergen I polypeptide chain 2-like n=1 Tax=Ovis canadensis TaxID=37174 RepID=UPI003750304B